MKKTIRAKAVLSALILMTLFMTINENVNAGWSEMECSTDQWMTDVWGTSDTNIYAVGGRGEIFRYDGDGDNDGDPDEIWEEMSSGTSHDLFAIWGSSDLNIYVVGHTGTVRHYDGTGWTNIAGEVGAWPNDLLNVWGSSDSDIFIIGVAGLIFHYNGSEWVNQSIPGVSSGDLYGIWGSSSDVFAVNDSGDVVYYNGTSWALIYSVSVPLCSVWGSSTDDVFVVGEDGTILHFNGSTWSSMDSGVSAFLYRVWGRSADDVFVVGEDGTILHYNGSSWSSMNSGTLEHLSGIWGSGLDVFVSGDQSTILRYIPDVTTTTTVLTTTVPTTIPTTTTSTTGICPTEAIYGEDSKEVELLRSLRDDVLSKTKEGKALIRLYYEWSPVIVVAIKHDEEFKIELKELIDGMMLLLGTEKIR